MIKKIIISLISLLLIFIIGISSVFGLNAYVKKESKNQILTVEEASKLEDIDCILILGCLVHSDGTLSALLSDRVNEAINVYETGVTKKILVSGDHGKVDYNEVQAMKNYITNTGAAKEEDIFMDHAGFSTYESIYRAKEIFGVKKMIIVTSEYHLYRALYIANKLGVDAYGVGPIDFYSDRRMREVREILARDKDYIKCIFKPKPTYLGEKIDIHGNGNVTND